MREAILHLDEKSHPIDLHLDALTYPTDAWMLLASIPGDPPHTQSLIFGNSNLVGNLLMTLYQRSVSEAPEFAYVMETLAHDIIKYAEALRGKSWPGEGPETTN